MIFPRRNWRLDANTKAFGVLFCEKPKKAHQNKCKILHFLFIRQKITGHTEKFAKLQAHPEREGKKTFFTLVWGGSSPPHQRKKDFFYFGNFCFQRNLQKICSKRLCHTHWDA